MSINLIIISRNNGSENYIDNIKSYNITTPENTNVIYPTDSVLETTLIIPLLRNDIQNLIIYDWSTTLSTTLNNQLTEIMTKTYDIVYLGKYLDTCNKYLLQSQISNVSLVSGTDPVGFNAVLMTGAFAERLKQEMESKTYYSIIYAIQAIQLASTITSLAISPNLLTYNPLYINIDSSKSFSVKSEECQPLTSQITPPSDNQLDAFWILLIIIGIAILIFILVKYTSFGTKSKEYMNKDYKK